MTILRRLLVAALTVVLFAAIATIALGGTAGSGNPGCGQGPPPGVNPPGLQYGPPGLQYGGPGRGTPGPPSGCPNHSEYGRP